MCKMHTSRPIMCADGSALTLAPHSRDGEPQSEDAAWIAQGGRLLTAGYLRGVPTTAPV
jgi:hypothetical protein